METNCKLSRTEKARLIFRYLRDCWGHFAAAIGCAAIRLDTWAGNTPAAALYQKNGFTLCGSAHVLFQGKIPEELICLEAPCRPADGTIAADEK